MKWKFTVILALTFSVLSFAQKIEYVKASAEGDLIYLDYKLVGDFAQQTFNVKVYCSSSEYAKPMQYTTGDVNRTDIAPGLKRIIIDGKKEFGEFEGEVAFKVTATVISDYSVINPFSGQKFKRGKEYTVQWEGFNPNTSVRIELIKNGQVVNVIRNAETGGNFSWNVRKSVKPGKYHIKIVDIKNRNAIAQSAEFKVKRAVPLVATMGTGGILTAGLAYLLLKPKVYDPLPFPPSPGE